jgi:hypothetical protein
LVDLAMRAAVDVPIAVARHSGRHDPVLTNGIKHLRCVPHRGPTGWNAGILEVMGSRVAG